MNWFVQALKQYATFSGRARRPEYWYFVLIYLLIFIVLSIADAITGSFDADTGIGLLGGLFALGMLVPWLAVGARRLHDTDRSGWWLLLVLLPVIGPVVLLVFALLRGTEGDNRYGPEPATEPG